MSPNHKSSTANVRSKLPPSTATSTPRALLLALFLTLAAIAIDQFVSPILHSSSPLWATAAFLLLLWRHRASSPSADESARFPAFSIVRIGVFLAAHIALVLAARSVSIELQPVAGATGLSGTLLAGLKLSVLGPTLLLFPVSRWRQIAAEYPSELIAALVVLFTYFPHRVLDTFWPSYGQVLGRFVFFVAGSMVSGLGYVRAFSPTLTGRELDVTILPACSGINGIELFQFLFGLLVFCDWNRLRKGRTLLGYFMGLGFILLGNALRITSFVVLGNHGLSGLVMRFHISAGWIFFSLVFLLYLALFYRWMLSKDAIRRNSIPSSGETEYDGILQPRTSQSSISKI